LDTLKGLKELPDWLMQQFKAPDFVVICGFYGWRGGEEAARRPLRRDSIPGGQ
jgi:hypothetical protein